MKRRFSPFTVPNWFIYGIVGLFIVTLIIIFYCFTLYNGIQANKEKGFNQSEQLVLKNTDIVFVESVSRYHGDRFYHVVEGKTEHGKAALAFLAVGDNSDITYFLMEDFINIETIVNTWESTCNSCRLIDSKIALDNGVPLLELNYIDKKGRYVFDYYSLYDGNRYEQFRLKQSIYTER